MYTGGLEGIKFWQLQIGCELGWFDGLAVGTMDGEIGLTEVGVIDGAINNLYLQ